jgi:tetratricopeptide (TPR) repeat protein
MTKYRLRLSNGRVIGPFEKHELYELKARGRIRGTEEAQVFPLGNWEPLDRFDFYGELQDGDRTRPGAPPAAKAEETFMIDLAQLRGHKQEKELEEYEQETVPPIEQLTETVRFAPETPAPATPAPTSELPSVDLLLETKPSDEFYFELEIDGEAVPPDLDADKQTILNPIAQQELEKLRRQQEQAEARRRAEEEKARKRALDAERALVLRQQRQAAPAITDEHTQVIRIDGPSLLRSARQAELDIEAELRAIQRRENKREIEEEDQEGAEVEDSAAKEKRNRLILICAAAAILYAIFFPDDKPAKPKFQHLEPRIVFPIPFDQSDVLKSKAEYKKGIEVFGQGSYPALVKAGLLFKSSYENDLENRDALGLLVRSYGEQLQHSTNKLADAQTLFNLIQSKRPFLLQDPNGVIGMNLFYMAINKPAAAVDVVQKYLKLQPKNVTQELFAVYVRSLLKLGRIDLAKQFYQALENAPDKNRYTYQALVDYHLLNQEMDRAAEYAGDALKRNPRLAGFYLLNAELNLRQRKSGPAVPLLKKAEELGLDHNNRNLAKFYELKGIVLGLRQKPQAAAVAFQKSLAIYDSEELRVKLADLQTSNGAVEDADRIIEESKAVKLLLQAKEHFEKKNYELALSMAARAASAFPGHIASELFLAKVQLRLGHAQQGLKTIDALLAKYPDDKKINMAMIEAFIETYKFNDARNRLQIIASTGMRESWEFASLNAKLYSKMGDALQAMSWLRRSISINPLNDADIFALSQILHKKANFDSARVLLNKCMELDPVNPDYRIAYARLLYETQDDLAAIGYLLSLREDFGENPKIMSEVAIFYYRSGKVKDFQDYKQKLERDHGTDKVLYEFLIKAALLDERFDEVPGLVEKLLAKEPGDLEQMMTTGRVLFERGKLPEAAKWFRRVKDKLPSYPKVLYYIAKIEFLTGDVDAALKKIEEDIKANGENDDDLVFMAQIYQVKEKLVEAENFYKRAQKLNPKSYEAIMGLADLSTKRNNHDLALDLYKRAMKLRQDEPLVHKKIGDVYRQLGQGALAIEAYKLYLDMDPESPHKSNLEAYINLMQ